MDPDLLKLLGAGSITGALLFLIYLVGNRLVAALDRVASKVDDHTTKDLAHHAEVRESVVRLESKVDTVLGMTPLDEPPPRPRTPARGVRPNTQGDR